MLARKKLLNNLSSCRWFEKQWWSCDDTVVVCHQLIVNPLFNKISTQGANITRKYIYCNSEMIKVFNLIRMKYAWCHHLQGYCHFSAVRKLGQHTAIWQNITHYTPFWRCINKHSNNLPCFVWVWLPIHFLFCWSHQKRSHLSCM